MYPQHECTIPVHPGHDANCWAKKTFLECYHIFFAVGWLLLPPFFFIFKMKQCLAEDLNLLSVQLYC